MTAPQTNLGQLGNLVEDERLKVLFKTATDLKRRVNKDPYSLEVGFAPDSQEVKIFDTPVTIDANLDVTAKIHDPDEDGIPFFATGDLLTPPDSKSLAEFAIEAGIDASTSLDLPFNSQFALAFKADAGAGFEYRHVRPVRRTIQRETALEEVVRGTRLPAKIKPHKLAEGEGHSYYGRFNFDLGLDATFGGDLDLKDVIEIFDDFPIELKAHIDYSLKASVGYSFYGDMRLAIARYADNDFVRMRLERSRKSDLTLGAKIALQAEYDFGGSSLIAILDNALAQDSAQEIFSALNEVQEIAERVGSGDWDQISKELGERAGEALEKFVAKETKWKDWLAGSDEVTEVLAISKKIVDTYNDVDDTVKSWWNDLIGSVGLGQDGKIRQHLRRIADISPANFDISELTSGNLRHAVDLVETLSGKELEDFILDSAPEIEVALSRAQKLAKDALKVLDELPNDFLDKFHEFAKKTGIDEAVKWLAANATSKGAIEDKIEARIKNLAEQLVRKAWDKIDDDDLARIQAWAQELDGFLDNVKNFDQPLRAHLKKLKGKTGFSIALEWQRTTQTSALIDFDFDPKHRRVRNVVMAGLKDRNIRNLLNDLPEPDDGDLPYSLREASFNSRRIRSRSAFFSWSGKKSKRRIEESSIRVRQDGNDFVRDATYTGGFTRTLEINDGYTGSASVWLQASAEGEGKDLSQPYGTPEFGMRWTFDRTDFKTTNNELDAIDDMLENFGFIAPGEDPARSAVPQMVQTRFTMGIHLDQTAAEAYFADSSETHWNESYAEAAKRWYVDALVDKRLGIRDIRLGEALSKLVDSDSFKALFGTNLVSPSKFDKWASREYGILFRGTRRIRVRPQESYAGEKPKQILLGVLEQRRKALRRHEKAAELFAEALESPDHDALDKLMRKTSRAFRATEPGNWNNPMFCIWLALVRVMMHAETQPHVKGLAMLQWRASDAEEWSEPVFWHLDPSL